MKFDLGRASAKLSELDLKIEVDGWKIDILWFRVMMAKGEWVIGRHTHSSFEFHFIASGCCQVVLDDRKFVVHAGQFYMTAPGVYHEQRGIGNEQHVEYCLNCEFHAVGDDHGRSVSEVQHAFHIFMQTPCKAFDEQYGALKYFDSALQEAFEQKFGFYNTIKNLAAMILIAAARNMEEALPMDYKPPLKKRKDDYRFNQIKRFIEDNVSSPISTKDIASHMYLSDKQICRIIQKSTDLTAKELMSKIRFDKAKQLLKETEMSIKEVSNMLGFSSEYYFNQFFKRYEGYPPGEYRSNIQRHV